MKIYSLIFCCIICACNFIQKNNKNDIATDKLNMIETDKNFSKLCEEKGVKVAFMEYIDSNGVLLRPNQNPIIGGDAIYFLTQLNDTSYSLKWQPKSAEIATSGDLGYVYGIYSLKPSKKDTTVFGTYVSIWRKQIDGSWKFVLDSGNEGVGE